MLQPHEQALAGLRRQLVRGVFALGVASFAASFALGIYQSVHTSARPPELPFDELGQARQFAGAGNREAAARQLRTYALINAQNADGWLRLGRYLWQGLGDRKGAIEAYEHTLLTLPTPPETHQALAILYAAEGLPSQAEKQATLAAEAGLPVPPEVWRAIALGGGAS